VVLSPLSFGPDNYREAVARLSLMGDDLPAVMSTKETSIPNRFSVSLHEYLHSIIFGFTHPYSRSLFDLTLNPSPKERDFSFRLLI
jgi:hypothetical protein